jgi:predicted amidophosphoribosyltransferase
VDLLHHAGIHVVYRRLLRRTRARHDVPSQAQNGGRRSRQVHEETTAFSEAEVITECEIVILLDDVTTSGLTLEVCENILLENGAKSVVCAAIGKTA